MNGSPAPHQPERATDQPTFTELLRMPPFVEELPDTSDLRAELPQERDLGLDQ